MNNIKKIIKYYNDNDTKEWNRLFSDNYHQIEYLVTWHYLNKYLPKKGKILDAGGGPGRYTIELAKKNYKMSLCDTSQKLLDIAKQKIQENKISKNVEKITNTNISNLFDYSNNYFDAVICLGAPLSHLTKIPDRIKAIREIKRITKPGGIIFLGVLSKYGAFPRHVIKSSPELINNLTTYLKNGNRILKKNNENFTDAHYFSTSEIRQLAIENKFKILDIATLEGVASGLKEQINKLDKTQFKNLIKFLITTSNESSTTDMSEHLLLVAKKRS